MRLIDADALRGEFDPSDKTEFDAVGVRYYIHNAPTIDAVPVVHGRWIAQRDYPGTYSRCSNCEQMTKGYTPMMRYCPAYGARMDAEEARK